jgi:hypothetical protein
MLLLTSLSLSLSLCVQCVQCVQQCVGEIVLYESHSVIHGRPFPFKGRFFANLFVHFEPYAPLEGEAHDPNSDIPPYIIKDSLWEKEWKKTNPDGWKFVSIVLSFFLCSKFVFVFEHRTIVIDPNNNLSFRPYRKIRMMILEH